MFFANCTVTTNTIAKGEETYMYISAGKREEPYYSVVNIKRPDAIEMKQNEAYEKVPELPPLHVENPAYGVHIQES